jgi:hypothetical protein
MDNHRTGFNFWWDGDNNYPYNTYDHIVFSNNVIKRTTPPLAGTPYGSIHIDTISGSGALPRCSRAENNVIYGTHVFFGGPGQDAAWSPNPSSVSPCPDDGLVGSVNNNLFVDLPDGSSLPPGHSGNLFNVGNPLLCNPDPLSNPTPTIYGYYVTAASPAVARGIYQPLAPLDYEGISRAPPAAVNIGINQNTTCR